MIAAQLANAGVSICSDLLDAASLCCGGLVDSSPMQGSIHLWSLN
nr:hypothetical protein [uncultured Deefgea sp.]